MSEDAGKDDVYVDQKSEADLELYSVTTIIGEVQRAHAIEAWGRKEVARAALEDLDYWATVQEHEGTDEAIWRLAGAPFKKKRDPKTGELLRSATQLGSFVHHLCEEYAITGRRPDIDPDDEAVPFLDRFEEWAQAAQPRFIAAEMNVYHPGLVYAGCMDAVWQIETASHGTLTTCVDYKTSRRTFTGGRNSKPTQPYPESATLQLAAYRNAEWALPVPARRFESNRSRYYLLGEPERAHLEPPPATDEVGFIVYLTPRFCHAHPVTLDDRVWRKFQIAIEMFEWLKEEAPRTMFPPLSLPELVHQERPE